jgi:HlyD family secretion protein
MANGQHRRPPKPLIAAVVVAVLAGLGWWWWSTQGGGATSQTSLSGTVESTEYQVASAIAGRIETVTVREGDVVKTGDVIARLDDRALRLQLQQANQGVVAAKAQVDYEKSNGSSAEVRAARARLEQAKAAVNLAKVQLGYATVTAPAGGVVVALAANAGENAGPGKTLVTLADTSDLFVRVYVPEPDIGGVKLDQDADVTGSGASGTGTVSFIASEAEFTPNTVETKEQRGNLVYEVRVRLTSAGAAFKPGLPVDIALAESAAK